MESKAANSFDENKKDVERLLEIHKELAGDSPGRKWGVAVLNKSAIVLTCAVWEAFIEDLVGEAIKHLLKHLSDPTKLPTALKQEIAKAVKEDKNELSPWNLAGDAWKVKLQSNADQLIAKYTGAWNTPKSAQIKA